MLHVIDQILSRASTPLNWDDVFATSVLFTIRSAK